jgi:hypothetical protein
MADQDGSMQLELVDQVHQTRILALDARLLRLSFVRRDLVAEPLHLSLERSSVLRRRCELGAELLRLSLERSSVLRRRRELGAELLHLSLERSSVPLRRRALVAEAGAERLRLSFARLHLAPANRFALDDLVLEIPQLVAEALRLSRKGSRDLRILRALGAELLHLSRERGNATRRKRAPGAELLPLSFARLRDLDVALLHPSHERSRALILRDVGAEPLHLSRQRSSGSLKSRCSIAMPTVRVLPQAAAMPTRHGPQSFDAPADPSSAPLAAKSSGAGALSPDGQGQHTSRRLLLLDLPADGIVLIMARVPADDELAVALTCTALRNAAAGAALDSPEFAVQLAREAAVGRARLRCALMRAALQDCVHARQPGRARVAALRRLPVG